MEPTQTSLKDSEIIEAFGGASAVARLFKIKQPSVTEWKTAGIPPARRQVLELLRPELFASSSLELPPDLTSSAEAQPQ